MVLKLETAIYVNTKLATLCRFDYLQLALKHLGAEREWAGMEGV